jgi:hypothetical protein
MQPLVLQLEAECLDSQISILEVLRKAMVVARKLSLVDAQAWIGRELNGYKSGDAAPPHRLLVGQIRAWNPYHGWIPIMFQDSSDAKLLSKCFVGQPVGELDDLVKHGEGFLQFPFDSETERHLMKGLDLPFQPTRHLSRAAVSGIIEAVRNLVLDWCLQLERDGIVGEGLVFSAQEKEASARSSYNINYNAPVAHSQIQQGSPSATQTMSVGDVDRNAVGNFIKTLKEHASELRLNAQNGDQLQAEIQQVETQIASKNTSHNILHESLRTIRTLLEGCAGSLIASGLLFELAKLLK